MKCRTYDSNKNTIKCKMYSYQLYMQDTVKFYICEMNCFSCDYSKEISKYWKRDFKISEFTINLNENKNTKIKMTNGNNHTAFTPN